MQRLHAQLISHAEPGFDKSQKQMAAFRKQRSAGAGRIVKLSRRENAESLRCYLASAAKRV
jgi:hypothetical protein